MAILIDRDTKVVVQNITGAYGRNQTMKMKEYGTNVVAGTSPGKSRQEIFGIPIYNTISEAMQDHEINASIVYVSAPYTREAVLEAIESKVKLIVIATEGVPLHDTVFFKRLADEEGIWIVGPNTIGMISPGKCLLGSLAPSVAFPGRVGLISRSGTLSITFIHLLKHYGIGISTAIGIGGDGIIGKNTVDYLKLFENDPETDAVVMIGEIGSAKELEAARYIKDMSKPVFSFIAGISAPKGKRMGHIGAIAFAEDEGAEYKKKVLASANSVVADRPWELIEKLKQYLDDRSREHK